jgi:hypothetical protein
MKNSAVNLTITNNSDGFDVAGGNTQRKLTVTSGDIHMTAGGAFIYTFPSATTTLVGTDATQTLSNKTLTAGTILGASTTSDAQLFLSSGSNPTSPTNGMLWYNGTNLYFRHGGSSVDLLAGGGGGGISSWSTVTGTSQTASSGSGYITNNASLVTVTLPTPSVGALIEIVGLGAGGWRAQCASSHTIRLGQTVSASTGYAESTDRYDSMRAVGVSSTQWHVVYSVGNINVA